MCVHVCQISNFVLVFLAILSFSHYFTRFWKSDMTAAIMAKPSSGTPTCPGNHGHPRDKDERSCAVISVRTTVTTLILLILPSTIFGCTGRTVLNSSTGTLTDGPDNYPPSAHCEWLIDGT